MKETLKIMFFVILAVIYLNIGYQYSETVRQIVQKHSADTFIENVISGGWNVLFVGRSEYGTYTHIIMLFFWPVTLIFSLVLWIVFGFWQFLILFWWGIQFLWWFIFCGGMFKLLGTIGTKGIAALVVGSFMCWVLYIVVKDLPPAENPKTPSS